jgi:hypothetical protein
MNQGFVIGAGILAAAMWVSGAPVWAIVGSSLIGGIAAGAWNDLGKLQATIDKREIDRINRAS